MTSRERVKLSLSHKQPDRIPIDFGSCAVTGMHYSCVAGLREYYGLPKHPIVISDPIQMLGTVEPDLKEALGIDVEGVLSRTDSFGVERTGLKEWKLENGEIVLISDGHTVTTDASGNYVIPAEEGVYTITYTVDCLKFGENAPNGAIKRIRVFTVAASEEDGRGEEVAD